MLLEGKKILIMGIRNKWSIAFGIAKSAYENGAQLLFTYMGEENKDKIESLISEFKGSKAYVLNGASEDEKVREVFTKIKEENGKIDGIVHAIAHANTEDLHNDFILTSKEGYSHACDVSAYSFVLVSRMTNEELNAKLKSLKQELFNLRFSHATGQLTNPMQLNKCKKDIAKVNTILTERAQKNEGNA